MKLLNFANWWKKQIKVTQKHPYRHSGRMDSKTIHSTIDAPPGVPGESKISSFLYNPGAFLTPLESLGARQ